MKINLYYKSFVPVVLGIFLGVEGSAQTNSYDAVYAILQNNCAISCHSSKSKMGNLDLGGSAAQVYENMVNIDPVNPTAKAKGDKRIYPGDPHKSYLLRKCNYGLDPDNFLTPNEGAPMPKAGPLKKNEIEIIRQWILFGAKQTGKQFDTTLINTYYRGKGIDATVDASKFPAPEPDSGFQLHFGPIFLGQKTELEYFIKEATRLVDDVDVTRLDMKMTNKSHHYIMHKFVTNDQNIPPGLRLQNGGTVDFNQEKFVSAWAFAADNKLPAGTAFRWEKNTVLDHNFHLNNNSDSVLMADVRINVYTTAKGSNKIMYTDLFPHLAIEIPNDNKNHTFTASYFDPTQTNMFDVWLLSSHTHKYGVDYDIYKSKNDHVTKEKQIYEGFYDTEYKFNQGYYDWAHPAVRRFSQAEQVDPRAGLIHEAIYKNTGTAPVKWGFTTDDEMMLIIIQYTLGAPLSVEENDLAKNIRLFTYPNPYKESIQIQYNLKEKSKVQVEIYNIIGERVHVLADEMQHAGEYTYSFNAKRSGYPAGIYFARIKVNEASISWRIIQTE